MTFSVGHVQGKLVQAEYHLSLSRTVAVRRHQIQPLVADLRRCLAETARRAAYSLALHLLSVSAGANHIWTHCTRCPTLLLHFTQRSYRKGRQAQSRSTRKYYSGAPDTKALLRCRFSVELGALQAFANDERTRSFLALEVLTGAAEARAPGLMFHRACE